MPKLSKISEAEFNIAPKPKAKPKRISKNERVQRRYQRYLEPFAKGGYVEVSMAAGEKRQTVKNHLKRAAKELGLTLEFKRTKGKIRFEVKSK